MRISFCKNTIRNLWLLGLLFAAFGQARAQSSWEIAKQEKKGEIIVYYFDFEPFFYEEGKTLKGIEHELMESFRTFVQEKYGVELSIRYLPNPMFQSLYQQIKNGSSGEFGAASFSITPERLQEVKFTLPYMPDVEVLISSYNVPIAADTTEFIEAFEGLTALSMRSSTYDRNLDKLQANVLPNMQKEYMEHFDEIAERISEEDNLYGYSQLSSYLLARQQGLRIRRQNMFKVRNAGGYGIAYPLASDWNEPMNAFFTSPNFKQEMEVIVKKYFGEDVNDLIREIAAQDTSARYQDVALLTKEYEIQNLELTKQTLEIERQQFIRNSAFLGVFLALVLIVLLYNQYQIKRKSNTQLTSKNQEIAKKQNELLAQTEELQQLNEAMLSQREFIERQNLELKNQNLKMHSSVQSAKLIQEAMLPFESRMQEALQEYFVIYRPRDVVSGDFYWLRAESSVTYAAAVDCTGHGIPGAFMSMIGNSLLDKVLGLQKVENLGEALHKIDVDIKIALKQEFTGDVNGMDAILVGMEAQADQTVRIRFSGAKRPLYYWDASTEQLHEQKGNRSGLGGNVRKQKEFVEHQITLPKGSILYLTTDGFADQNNEERKKYGGARLRKTLQQIAKMPLVDQKAALEATLETHQGVSQQRDDILVWGIRI